MFCRCSGTGVFLRISRIFLKTFFTENTRGLYLLILFLVVFIAIINTTCFSSPFDKGILKNFLHHPLFVPVLAYFTSRSKQELAENLAAWKYWGKEPMGDFLEGEQPLRKSWVEHETFQNIPISNNNEIFITAPRGVL